MSAFFGSPLINSLGGNVARLIIFLTGLSSVESVIFCTFCWFDTSYLKRVKKSRAKALFFQIKTGLSGLKCAEFWLKVKYGVGIFDSRATLTLRYRVIPKLYIEAVSGVDQALDLLYAFEF